MQKVFEGFQFFQAQAASITRVCGRGLRVNPRLRLADGKKRAINGQFGLGPNLFKKQAFAPTGVGNDHI
jgi:hypothetical protein